MNSCGLAKSAMPPWCVPWWMAAPQPSHSATLGLSRPRGPPGYVPANRGPQAGSRTAYPPVRRWPRGRLRDGPPTRFELKSGSFLLRRGTPGDGTKRRFPETTYLYSQPPEKTGARTLGCRKRYNERLPMPQHRRVVVPSTVSNED